MFISPQHDTMARVPSLATRLKADKSYFIEAIDPHDRYMYRLARMVCQCQSKVLAPSAITETLALTDRSFIRPARV